LLLLLVLLILILLWILLLLWISIINDLLLDWRKSILLIHVKTLLWWNDFSLLFRINLLPWIILTARIWINSLTCIADILLERLWFFHWILWYLRKLPWNLRQAGLCEDWSQLLIVLKHFKVDFRKSCHSFLYAVIVIVLAV
jgi:hypothetical protein